MRQMRVHRCVRCRHKRADGELSRAGHGPLPGQPGYGEPVADPGAPVPQQGPYGQPAYGQPAYGQAQEYGAPHQYAPLQAYGGPQYGAPPSQSGLPHQYGPPQQYGYGPPPTRPGGGTVITAAVIQIVQASLFVIVALVILFLADMVNTAGDEFDQQVGSDVSGTTDSVSRWVAIGGLLLLAGAVFMIVLAALAIRGRRWAAITSVVLQVLAALASLAGLRQSDAGDSPGFAVVFLLASVAVVVLFLLPASTAYLAARTALPR